MLKEFIVLFALICPFLVAEEFGACSVCTSVVDLLEGQSSKLGTKEEWLQKLRTISDEVCSNLPQTVASPTQCKSFIELNAPYIVDLIVSESKPQSVCKTIGICNESQDTKNYKFIFPNINEQQITYVVEEKDITKDSTFNYKLFLGFPSFLNNQSYQLGIELNTIIGCDVNLRVTNFTTFVQSESCNSEKNCSMLISQPGQGVWYYISVHAKLSGDKASFSLNATEQNQTLSHWILVSHHTLDVHRFTFILCMTFSSLCLLCMCISRCMFTKRRAMQRRRFQQAYSPVMMQPMPESIFPMQNMGMYASQEPFDPDAAPMILVYAPQPTEYSQV